MIKSLIEIHMIQNHCPANLNRDDLGSPKTCFFGGVLRSRISSQCLKRSIRTSADFADLVGGIRTRRLAELISQQVKGKDVKNQAKEVLAKCGIKSDKEAGSDMLVFTTHKAVKAMAQLLQNEDGMHIDELKAAFTRLIENEVQVPDMALCGRMLETGVMKHTTVEAALQVAHAISTHEARPEIDYYVAVDDIKGDDAGAGFVAEAMFSSACFYKYFSIDCSQLLTNLGDHAELAAKTIGAFIYAAVRSNPSGKQNSYAAHNYPDGILIEIKERPFNYANAFVRPVVQMKDSDLVTQTIGQLANYIDDMNKGYGLEGKQTQIWFSPNHRHPLVNSNGDSIGDQIGSIDELVSKVVSLTGHDWNRVRELKVNEEA
ncbi:MAG TPA: type I-E CRISPR-associated protein Cas7/Cse4/CasC [Candidatus Cloacimonadota bacterium]|nr:type I-E CRISPR-associated protein Cas7/Cse4/CasC [Candidatus Cloacimonadota bacterium]